MLRLLFLGCLVIMLIPVADDSATGEGQTISARETITAAQALYKDLSGFCERNPQTCDTGKYLAQQFERKARTGAGMALAYFAEPVEGSTKEPAKHEAPVDPVKTGSTSK